MGPEEKADNKATETTIPGKTNGVITVKSINIAPLGRRRSVI